MSAKTIFGTVIAIILLGLYVYLVISAITTVSCTPQPDCLTGFNDPMGSAMSLIGGLVSALVIAELAVTVPGEIPVARSLGIQPSAMAAPNRSGKVVMWVTTIYLAVWILTGLAAFVVGLRAPNVLPNLTDVGQSWLGLAVAAAYAYFELKPAV